MCLPCTCNCCCCHSPWGYLRACIFICTFTSTSSTSTVAVFCFSYYRKIASFVGEAATRGLSGWVEKGGDRDRYGGEGLVMIIMMGFIRWCLDFQHLVVFRIRLHSLLYCGTVDYRKGSCAFWGLGCGGLEW